MIRARTPHVWLAGWLGVAGWLCVCTQVRAKYVFHERVRRLQPTDTSTFHTLTRGARELVQSPPFTSSHLLLRIAHRRVVLLSNSVRPTNFMYNKCVNVLTGGARVRSILWTRT